MSKLIETLKHAVHVQGGFLTAQDVQAIAEHDRLRQLLVRCGNCRFVTAAQSVEWLSAIIKRDGQDYVRDVSLLADDPAYRLQETKKAPPAPRQTIHTEDQYMRLILSDWREDQCGGVFDGSGVHSDADPGL